MSNPLPGPAPSDRAKPRAICGHGRELLQPAGEPTMQEEDLAAEVPAESSTVGDGLDFHSGNLVVAVQG